VWVDEARLAAAAACASGERFEEAHRDARRARGVLREGRAPIVPGDRVWVFGELRAASGGGAPPSLAPAKHGGVDGGLLVATTDPRIFCRRSLALVAAFMVGAVAIAGASTALAGSSPVFGLVSKIGAALCLAYFLLVQPAGTAVRDAVRMPH